MLIIWEAAVLAFLLTVVNCESLLELLNMESQIRTVRESQIAQICQGLAETLAATNDFAGLLRLGVVQDTMSMGILHCLIVSHQSQFQMHSK